MIIKRIVNNQKVTFNVCNAALIKALTIDLVIKDIKEREDAQETISKANYEFTGLYSNELIRSNAHQ